MRQEHKEICKHYLESSLCDWFSPARWQGIICFGTLTSRSSWQRTQMVTLQNNKQETSKNIYSSSEPTNHKIMLYGICSQALHSLSYEPKARSQVAYWELHTINYLPMHVSIHHSNTAVSYQKVLLSLKCWDKKDMRDKILVGERWFWTAWQQDILFIHQANYYTLFICGDGFVM